MIKLKHVIKAQQFSREMLEEIFIDAHKAEQIVRDGGRERVLQRKGMITFFYEPSTRTRASFEIAMRKMGGEVIFSTENAKEFSSAAKGESLEDTIKVLCGFAPNVIVLRHHESGAAERAAAVSSVPIINAGDGPGQHPTQALLDAFTIKKEIGRIDGLKIALVGDLAHGRTVRSLAYLLSKFDKVKIFFVAPDVVRIGEDIKDHLREHKIDFEEESDLMRVAREVDVIYQTRIQRERFGDRVRDYEQARGKFIINGEVLSVMKERSIIMHPLPRVDEIVAEEVDPDPRAAYFRQAENGLFLRMALLKDVLIG